MKTTLSKVDHQEQLIKELKRQLALKNLHIEFLRNQGEYLRNQLTAAEKNSSLLLEIIENLTGTPPKAKIIALKTYNLAQK